MTNKDIKNIVISTKEQRIKLSNNLILRVIKYKDFYLGTTGKITKKLGRFPDMSLDEALYIANNYDISLDNIYFKYLQTYSTTLSKKTISIKNNLFSYFKSISHIPINKITRSNLIKTLSTPYSQGKYEIVKRSYNLIKTLHDYANIQGLIDSPNPFTIPISKIYSFPKTIGYSWIDDIDSLKALIDYIITKPNLSIEVHSRLVLNLFLGLRAINISSLTSNHLISKNTLYFKANEMKTNDDFYLGITPLLAKAISNLTTKTISTESINKALRDYKPENIKGNFRFTNHSFRKVLATFCRNYGKFSVDYIDATLSHKVGSQITRTYMKSNDTHITREVISWYQDFLFSLDSRLKDLLVKIY